MNIVEQPRLLNRLLTRFQTYQTDIILWALMAGTITGKGAFDLLNPSEFANHGNFYYGLYLAIVGGFSVRLKNRK